MRSFRTGILSFILVIGAGMVSAQEPAKPPESGKDPTGLETKVDKMLRGTWESKLKVGKSELATTLTFVDGRLTIQVQDNKVAATYKVVDEKTLQIGIVGGKPNFRKTNFAVDKDLLTLQDQKGKTIFTRVKKEKPKPPSGS